MNCMVFDGLEGGGTAWLSTGIPNRHNKPGLSQAMHVHMLERDVHCINYFKIAMSLGPMAFIFYYEVNLTNLDLFYQ